MCSQSRIRSFLIFWSGASILALIGLSITVVRLYYQADKMIASTCNTALVTRVLRTVTCDCGKNCGRTCAVKCTFVQVSYDSPVNGTRRIGKLFYGEHDLDKQCYRSYKTKCTDCPSTDYNYVPPEGTFNCWIDPENDRVLENRLYDSMSVFHAIFWPLFSFVISLCGWVEYLNPRWIKCVEEL